MKVVIISDLHANREALEALPETYTELWVLGDLVNFGPDPASVVDFVRNRADVILRGNHDQAVAYDQDPRCAERYRRMADSTRRYSASVLNEEQKEFLRTLPPQRTLRRQNTNFYLCHAKPSDPLYGYIPPDSPEWSREVRKLETDVLLVGHTHLPMMRRIGERLIVNPGSLGQTLSGKPDACYAVWEDGLFQLKTHSYRVESTVAKLHSLSFPSDVEEDLVHILRTGTLRETTRGV
jgi:putative phosphoesterase